MNKPFTRSGFGGLVTRPWGSYEVLLDEVEYKVKKITVSPNSRISYQSHENRREYWVVTSGQGLVTLDGRDSTVRYGAIVSIPAGAKHRIENTDASKKLVFIEVQTGQSFSEEDIVRYQDDYGRAQEEQDV